MITALLLIIIYLAFISLGLPDTIIGVTIPALQDEFGISLASGGLLSMIVIGGTVISSFMSDKIIKKFGTGKVVFISCLITGTTLFGFSQSPSFYWLLLLAFPLGFGGGTVDVALNNYVATHFKAHHMNWLHSFWGVGATIGPIIMSLKLMSDTWQSGFSTIATLQLSLTLLLLFSLSLWKKHKEIKHNEDESYSDKNIFKNKGIKFALLTMLLYNAIEIGTGLWSSSYLISQRGLSADVSARFVALYYTGITIGRFLSGFISFKLNNTQMIRLGVFVALSGICLLLLPLPSIVLGIGIIIIGFGLAPIFPAMIQETPNRFGTVVSQKVIGYQMGFAYIGSAIVPPTLGVLYQEVSLSLFPITLLLLSISLLITTEKLNSIIGFCGIRNADVAEQTVLVGDE